MIIIVIWLSHYQFSFDYNYLSLISIILLLCVSDQHIIIHNSDSNNIVNLTPLSCITACVQCDPLLLNSGLSSWLKQVHINGTHRWINNNNSLWQMINIHTITKWWRQKEWHVYTFSIRNLQRQKRKEKEKTTDNYTYIIYIHTRLDLATAILWIVAERSNLKPTVCQQAHWSWW